VVGEAFKLAAMLKLACVSAQGSLTSEFIRHSVSFVISRNLKKGRDTQSLKPDLCTDSRHQRNVHYVPIRPMCVNDFYPSGHF
jgi:hypothetical protein